MEALKFVVVLLVVVFVQVFGALGTPLSSEEEDREIWTVEDWQVKKIRIGDGFFLSFIHAKQQSIMHVLF